LEPAFGKALLLSYIFGRQTSDELIEILKDEDRGKTSRIERKYYRNEVLTDVANLVSVLSTENIWAPVSRHDAQGLKQLKAVKDRFADEASDHFFLVKVFDTWLTEKQTSSSSELTQWCRKKYL